MRYRPAPAPGLGRQLPRKSAARSAYPWPTYPTLLAAGRDLPLLDPPPAPRSAAATFIFSVKASSVASAAYTASSAALSNQMWNQGTPVLHSNNIQHRSSTGDAVDAGGIHSGSI